MTAVATHLSISDTLALPLDAVTEAFGVVGVRGSGKSYASKVLVEELTKAGLPVAILDPLGVHWGLRSSADGERPGLPFVILGGDHADVPLNDSAGELVADFVIAERRPTVLDMSLMRKAEMRRFATAFLSRLYHRNRQPLHLVVDEADLFAPQRVDDPTLLGAMEDIVRRGRSKGLGCTLITQRPAVIAKDVLTQISTLVALRLAGPQDRKALDEWVRANGTEEQRAEFLASLASLPTGTAWIWSPHWLGTFLKVAIRPLETFDSSATPKGGESLIQPRAFAEVDLEALRDRMAATVERAKADDPQELRRQIAELQRQLKATPTERVVERVEVPVLDGLLVKRLRADLLDIIDQAHKILTRADEACIALQHAAVAETAGNVDADVDTRSTVKRATNVAEFVKRAPVPVSQPIVRSENRNLVVSAAQQRILNAIARLNAAHIPEPSRQNVAALAGYSWRSGGYGNLLSSLRTNGYIEYPSPSALKLTERGSAVAEDSAPIRSVQDLHDAWMAILPGPEQKLLRVLLKAYPSELTREQLAAQTGYSAGSGGFGSLVSRLHTFGVVTYPYKGTVRAVGTLFPEEL